MEHPEEPWWTSAAGMFGSGASRYARPYRPSTATPPRRPAVAGPPVAQPVLPPLTASAVILVLTIDEGGEHVVRDLLADLSGLARAVAFPSPPGGLAVVGGGG